MKYIKLDKVEYRKICLEYNRDFRKTLMNYSEKIALEDCASITFSILITLMLKCGMNNEEIKEIISKSAKISKEFIEENKENEE